MGFRTAPFIYDPVLLLATPFVCGSADLLSVHFTLGLVDLATAPITCCPVDSLSGPLTSSPLDLLTAPFTCGSRGPAAYRPRLRPCEIAGRPLHRRVDFLTTPLHLRPCGFAPYEKRVSTSTKRGEREQKWGKREYIQIYYYYPLIYTPLLLRLLLSSKP